MAGGMPIMSKIQLEWAGGSSPGAPSGTGGGQRSAGGGDKDEGQNTNAPVNRKMLGNQKSFIKSSLGINVGVAAMLKQSQIFTGVIGTIFQLIGALVDVVLAPFLPVVVPAIKEMASWIPKLSSWARKTYEFLAPIFGFFKEQFDKLPGLITGPIGAIFTGVMVGTVLAQIFGFWGPWKSLLMNSVKGLWKTIQLVNTGLWKIAPAVNKVAGAVLKGIGTFLYDKIGKYVVAGLTRVWGAVKVLMNPIMRIAGGMLSFGRVVIVSLGNKIAGLLPTALKTALGVVKTAILNKLTTIFPAGWKKALGEAIAAAAKSGMKKLGGFLGRVGLKGAGAVLTGASKLPARDELGRFTKVVAKKPGVWAKAAKAVPLLSTAVTAGMAVHRTVGAARKGDWDLAAAYAGAGVAFTVGQLAADLSSVTGVGLAASGALAVTEQVALHQINKQWRDPDPPTNQDSAQNAHNQTAKTLAAGGGQVNANGGM